MSLQNKCCRTSLAFILICLFIPHVQAGFWDNAVNKAKSVTEEVITDTVDDMASKDSKSSDSSSKVSTNTSSEKKKQVVKNSTATKAPSAVANVQSASVTETSASQHSDVDIVGLKLGMTKNQIIAALKKHNKDFVIKIEERKRNSNERKQGAYLPDHVTNIKALILLEYGGGPYEHIYIYFSRPPNSVVNNITRTVGFAQEILTDTIVSSLKEKYGLPTSERGPSGGLEWEYTNSDQKAKCIMILRKEEGEFGGMMVRPPLPANACVGLVLGSNVDTSKKTLRKLHTTMKNHEEGKRQQLATDNYLSQLQEERRQKELKKASQASGPTL